MSDIQGDLSQAEIDAALARGSAMSMDEVLRYFENPAKEAETSPA
jgi:hypothetical protein